MGGKETIECQINCFSINHFQKVVDNKVSEFPLHLTDLTQLIKFFILTLFHTVSKIGMYGLIHGFEMD